MPGKRGRPKNCKHRWQPVSFAFETEVRLPTGTVLRQPDLAKAALFVVCMKCERHSYVVTEWVGFFINRHDVETSSIVDYLRVSVPSAKAIAKETPNAG